MAINKNKKFLVSVCDAYARDPNTKEGYFAGKANINTALDITMASTDVRGGEDNQLLLKYMHDRDVKISITSAIFQKQFLALNVGADVTSATNVQVQTTECADFLAGKATMTGTAVGKVAVFFPDGSCETVTPAAKAITLTDTTYNGQATLFYDVKVASGNSQISIGTKTPPKVIELTLIGKVKDATGAVVELMSITVPLAQVEGNYNLAFASDGVCQDKIDVSALASSGTACNVGDTYAIINFTPVPAV